MSDAEIIVVALCQTASDDEAVESVHARNQRLVESTKGPCCACKPKGDGDSSDATNYREVRTEPNVAAGFPGFLCKFP